MHCDAVPILRQLGGAPSLACNLSSSFAALLKSPQGWVTRSPRSTVSLHARQTSPAPPGSSPRRRGHRSRPLATSRRFATSTAAKMADDGGEPVPARLSRYRTNRQLGLRYASRRHLAVGPARLCVNRTPSSAGEAACHDPDQVRDLRQRHRADCDGGSCGGGTSGPTTRASRRA